MKMPLPGILEADLLATPTSVSPAVLDRAAPQPARLGNLTVQPARVDRP
jgi:hypothetical protein